jgi:3-phosphoshikimate 1-carboxyvinyltransferase
MIQALSTQRFSTTNLADSTDTQILAEILKNETAGDNGESLKKLDVEVTYNTGHGGTTIRFLTAFFASRQGTRILVGSERMNQRPIKYSLEQKLHIWVPKAVRQLKLKAQY